MFNSEPTTHWTTRPSNDRPFCLPSDPHLDLYPVPNSSCHKAPPVVGCKPLFVQPPMGSRGYPQLKPDAKRPDTSRRFEEHARECGRHCRVPTTMTNVEGSRISRLLSSCGIVPPPSPSAMFPQPIPSLPCHFSPSSRGTTDICRPPSPAMARTSLVRARRRVEAHDTGGDCTSRLVSPKLHPAQRHLAPTISAPDSNHMFVNHSRGDHHIS
jgi:hypothetical protein